MIIKIMGLMDIISGVTILLFHYELIPIRFLLAAILYLAIKGIAFRGDPASFIDIGIAIYMVIMLLNPFTIPSYIAAIYLFQKGISSLL